MSEKRSVTCDSCGKELVVDSPHPARYGLRLLAVNHGLNSSGITYSVHIEPPIDSPKDFCGMGCLLNWLHGK